MKRITLISVLLLSALVFVTLTTAAQGPTGRGMGMGPYDTKTEITVTGTVQAVQQHPGRGNKMGTHLLLKTKDSTLDVHVGSSQFVEQQGFTFSEGDTVEVTGSMTKTNDAILARIIKKGGKSLTLRSDTGKPLWAGGRGRS